MAGNIQANGSQELEGDRLVGLWSLWYSDRARPATNNHKYQQILQHTTCGCMKLLPDINMYYGGTDNTIWKSQKGGWGTPSWLFCPRKSQKATATVDNKNIVHQKWLTYCHLIAVMLMFQWGFAVHSTIWITSETYWPWLINLVNNLVLSGLKSLLLL